MQVISRIFVCVPREFSGKKSFMFPVIFSCDIARICFSCQTSGSVFRPKFLAFLSPTAPIDTEICFRRASAGARIPNIFSSTLQKHDGFRRITTIYFCAFSRLSRCKIGYLCTVKNEFNGPVRDQQSRDTQPAT